MVTTRLPIVAPVTAAYRDSLNTLTALGVLIGIALLITLASAGAAYFVTSQTDETSIADRIIAFAFGIAESFLLTPIMIAVHRFIILNEITPTYRCDPQRPTFRAFFAWLLALSISDFLVTLAMQWHPSTTGSLVLSVLFVLVAVIAVVVATLRLAILLPAIAVETPHATAANAWADTEGHGVRIFLIFVLATLPVAAIAIVAIFAIAGLDDASVPAAAVFVSTILRTFTLVLYVVLASRLFQALAQRLVGKELA
jgi:hypothetical protein